MSVIRSDTGTFAIIPTWVIDADISDRAIKLYAILAGYADNNTGECWPSRRLLADRLGCSVDSLDRARNELVSIGALIVTVRIDSDGSQRSNLYTVMRAIPQGGSRTDADTPLGTGAHPPLGTGAAHNYTQEELDQRTSKKRQRKPDVIFDAIVEVCGIDPSSLTSAARGSINRARADLARVGADPESIRRAADGYRRTWPTTTLTASALAKHYPTFVGAKPAPAPSVGPTVLGRTVDANPVWTLDDDGVARPVRPAETGLEGSGLLNLLTGTG